MTHDRTARRTGGGLPAAVPPGPGTGGRPAAARARAAVAAVAGAALVALLASGCASTAGAADAAQTATAGPTHPGATVPFGRPFEYADGLFVSVKAPQEFEPSPEAEGLAGGGVPVRLRVQVTNGTAEPYSPSTLSATAVSAGVEASPVWDVPLAIDTAGPYVTLDPAGTVAFDIAFAVADPSDLQITVLPALGGYDPLVVTTG
ncbi:hypothetical protein [Cellulomonas shaoxiangyii]|uniref:DUF4352 domain-containing protein n=1 Tax=Cellulomonas shaoxiangyii TaxID=2566013 RepID=A0A4P7SM84_9CELL|nr:hypothetical protein [Cellulomonas shaoxiangyii]QCB94878.1 hypothetical protein E5225_16240 [Cellulomonas shaoxiangyii]TGY85107.1 hypothetical protein E5226_08105 [Cellulomonas shaoxiangyii]